MTAEDIIRLLHLTPLEPEGGFFNEVYRSTASLSANILPARYSGTRPLATAIYYLFTPKTFSAMHRVRGDEIFHFYLGDPVEQIQLFPDGSGAIFTCGTDLKNGQRPLGSVLGNVWQGSRLKPGGTFALMGTTMSPGFHRDDFELGQRDGLIRQYPAYAEYIRYLTRK